MCLNLFAGFTKTAFSILKLANDLPQILFLEIGPHHGQEEKFAVCQLPKQEIADAALASGADKNVGIGKFAIIHQCTEVLDINVFWLPFAQPHLFRSTTRNLHHLLTTTVAQRQDNRQTGIFSGFIQNVWICLPLAFVLEFVVLLVIKNTVKNKKAAA